MAGRGRGRGGKRAGPPSLSHPQSPTTAPVPTASGQSSLAGTIAALDRTPGKANAIIVHPPPIFPPLPDMPQPRDAISRDEVRWCELHREIDARFKSSSYYLRASSTIPGLGKKALEKYSDKYAADTSTLVAAKVGGIDTDVSFFPEELHACLGSKSSHGVISQAKRKQTVSITFEEQLLAKLHSLESLDAKEHLGSAQERGGDEEEEEEFVVEEDEFEDDNDYTNAYYDDGDAYGDDGGGGDDEPVY